MLRQSVPGTQVSYSSHSLCTLGLMVRSSYSSHSLCTLGLMVRSSYSSHSLCTLGLMVRSSYSSHSFCTLGLMVRSSYSSHSLCTLGLMLRSSYSSHSLCTLGLMLRQSVPGTQVSYLVWEWRVPGTSVWCRYHRLWTTIEGDGRSPVVNTKLIMTVLLSTPTTATFSLHILNLGNVRAVPD